MKFIHTVFGLVTIGFILSAGGTARGVNLELIVKDATPSARFSFHHEATVGRLFTPDPSGAPVMFFTTGPTSQITSESPANPFRGEADASHVGGPTFSGLEGTLNILNGWSIVFTDGWMDFRDIDHDGGLVGKMPYARYDGAGALLDSGTYYAYDFNFGADDAPQSFEGSLSNGEFHLWMNNWDNVNQTREDFIANGDVNDTLRYGNYNGDAQGLDLAIRVPDGGLSVILLGLAISGLGAFQCFSRFAGDR